MTSVVIFYVISTVGMILFFAFALVWAVLYLRSERKYRKVLRDNAELIQERNYLLRELHKIGRK